MYDGQKGNNIALLGGPFWTVPELLFERKKLIPALLQLLTAFQIQQNTSKE